MCTATVLCCVKLRRSMFSSQAGAECRVSHSHRLLQRNSDVNSWRLEVLKMTSSHQVLGLYVTVGTPRSYYTPERHELFSNTRRQIVVDVLNIPSKCNDKKAGIFLHCIVQTQNTHPSTS